MRQWMNGGMMQGMGAGWWMSWTIGLIVVAVIIGYFLSSRRR